MASDGTFKRQILNVVDSANKMCGWILRTFTTRAATPMLTLWRSMVLSRLDYCSQLWCPIQTGDIQALEKVQRSFIRKISGIQHLNYWDQLCKLKLYSLERRRVRYIVIYSTLGESLRNKCQTSVNLTREESKRIKTCVVAGSVGYRKWRGLRQNLSRTNSQLAFVFVVRGCSMFCHLQSETQQTAQPKSLRGSWTDISQLCLMSLKSQDILPAEERTRTVCWTWPIMLPHKPPSGKRETAISLPLEAATHGHLGNSP